MIIFWYFYWVRLREVEKNQEVRQLELVWLQYISENSWLSEVLYELQNVQ